MLQKVVMQSLISTQLHHSNVSLRPYFILDWTNDVNRVLYVNQKLFYIQRTRDVDQHTSNKERRHKKWKPIEASLLRSQNRPMVDKKRIVLLRSQKSCEALRKRKKTWNSWLFRKWYQKCIPPGKSEFPLFGDFLVITNSYSFLRQCHVRLYGRRYDG